MRGGTLAQRRVVFLEGNIGAGKSTLGNRLKATGHFEFIPEPVAVWREKGMLKKFYDEPTRWAFTFQWAAFMTRAKTWHDIITATDHSRVVLERSIYCDRHVFAKNCYETGLMDEDEWRTYCELWDWLRANWCIFPECILYLRTPAKVCLQRIQRRGRVEEKMIPLDYLQDLERLHDEWLLNHPDALVLNGELDYMVEELLNLVEYGPSRVAYSPSILHGHSSLAAGGGAQS